VISVDGMCPRWFLLKHMRADAVVINHHIFLDKETDTQRLQTLRKATQLGVTQLGYVLTLKLCTLPISYIAFYFLSCNSARPQA
jgi:hypothetical protein